MPKKRATKPLTKAEKFYIEQNCESADMEAVAKDLRRSPSVIQKYYDECLTSKQESDSISAGDLMVTNKQRGYTVMTREASEVGESNRKAKDNVLSGKLKGHIHTIKD